MYVVVVLENDTSVTLTRSFFTTWVGIPELGFRFEISGFDFRFLISGLDIRI